MAFLGNVIWFIFGGFLSGLGYIAGGLSICATIVGIPFGVQTIKIGLATMTPFGKENVVTPDAGNLTNTTLNALWLIIFGWGIALSHLVHGAILAITVVGLPFAKQHFKLIPVALFPFGRQLQEEKRQEVEVPQIKVPQIEPRQVEVQQIETQQIEGQKIEG